MAELCNSKIVSEKHNSIGYEKLLPMRKKDKETTIKDKRKNKQKGKSWILEGKKGLLVNNGLL